MLINLLNKILLTLGEIQIETNNLDKCGNHPIVIDLLHWSLLKNRIQLQTSLQPVNILYSNIL